MAQSMLSTFKAGSREALRMKQNASQHILVNLPLQLSTAPLLRQSTRQTATKCRGTMKFSNMTTGYSHVQTALEPDLSWPTREEVIAYMRMARLHNVVPSILLVLVGAWAGSGRDPSALTSVTVWAMALISAGVTCGSMVINDYFDWKTGADSINAPHKPLPSGAAKPDGAVLLAGSVYVGVLMAACLLQSPFLRAIVAFSAGATLLYTPVFKRVTGVKNALVASVIALAPISGALAAGAGADVLGKLVGPCTFSFAAVMFREVLMDVADVDGDRAAGIKTLPVLFGPPCALAIAAAVLAAGTWVAVSALMHSSSTAAASAATATSAAVAALPHAVGAVLVMVLMGKFAGQVVGVYRAGFTREAIDQAVTDCLKPIGLAIIILSVLA